MCVCRSLWESKKWNKIEDGSGKFKDRIQCAYETVHNHSIKSVKERIQIVSDFNVLISIDVPHLIVI